MTTFYNEQLEPRILSIHFLVYITVVDARGVEKRSSRVGNGTEVKPKFKYPFLVRIWRDDLGFYVTNATHCAGTILNRHWVLTAAHCVIGVGDSHNLTVGDHDIYDKEPSEQALTVKQVIIHEKYK